MKQLFIFFCLTLFFFKVDAQKKVIYAIVDALRIREKSDLNAKVLAKMALGDSAVVLETSRNMSKATLQGVESEAFWLKVRTPKGETGWVFGSAVGDISYFPTPVKEGKIRDFITATKAGYTIKLKNGQTQKLTTHYPLSDGDDLMKLYYYDSYIAGIKSYVFRAECYEWTEYTLVNEINGEITEMAGKPKLSPDKKAIFCLWENEGASGYELYAVNGNSFPKIWEEEATETGLDIYPTDFEWINSNEIKIFFTKNMGDGKEINSSRIWQMNTKTFK
jgi:hypothetical protein